MVKQKIQLFLCVSTANEDVGGSACIALCILNLSTRWKWALSFMLWPLYLQRRAISTCWIGCWAGPKTGLEVVTKKENDVCKTSKNAYQKHVLWVHGAIPPLPHPCFHGMVLRSHRDNFTTWICFSIANHLSECRRRYSALCYLKDMAYEYTSFPLGLTRKAPSDGTLFSSSSASTRVIFLWYHSLPSCLLGWGTGSCNVIRNSWKRIV